MNLRVFVACAFGLCASLLRGAESDAEATAHKNALDVAGAFTNDGFKMRDGHWSGALKPHEPVLIAVNLYAGNQYWFSAGAEEKAHKMGVKLFDETGHPLAAEPYEAEARAAAGFSPNTSGQYFVALEIVEGEPAACCLLYSYK
jgi:hypothetical protein